MISKELLSEVLEENFSSNKIEFEQSRGVDSSRMVIDNWRTINIYELAHKCKEWAFKNGYYLTIYNDAIDVVLQSNCKVLENVTNDTFMYDPNLVFKGCQWILDNKESK